MNKNVEFELKYLLIDSSHEQSWTGSINRSSRYYRPCEYFTVNFAAINRYDCVNKLRTMFFYVKLLQYNIPHLTW